MSSGEWTDTYLKGHSFNKYFRIFSQKMTFLEEESCFLPHIPYVTIVTKKLFCCYENKNIRISFTLQTFITWYKNLGNFIKLWYNLYKHNGKE